MKDNISFVAYEDNGGSVYLFNLDKDGKAIAGYGNYEHTPNYCDIRRMGYSARLALDITEAEDD